MNAVITSARVGYDGYQDALLGLYVHVKLESGFHLMVEGHMTWYLPPSFTHHKRDTVLGYVIDQWLTAVGVDSVDKMVGKPIRVEFESDDWNAGVQRIGHIIEDDKWFSAKALSETILKENAK